jgi:hypothetical protein
MAIVPSHPASDSRGFLHALFEQAWQRRRARHRRTAALLLLGACVAAAALAVAGDRGPGSGPAGRDLVARRLVLSSAPGIGVACPGAPNSIACDRVGIAVSLPARLADVRATVAERSVRLHNLTTGACPRTGCFYTAYLSHAGLLHGALRVQPDQGRYRWFGRHPVTTTIGLTATYPDGTRAQTTRRAQLAPGWG